MRVRWLDDNAPGDVDAPGIVEIHSSDDDGIGVWESTPFNISLCRCDEDQDQECARAAGGWFYCVAGPRTLDHALRHPIEQTSEAIAVAHASMAQRGLVLHEVSIRCIPCGFPQAVLQLGDCLRDLTLTRVRLQRFPVAACRALAGTLRVLDVTGNSLLRLPHEVGELRRLHRLAMDAMPRYPPGMQRLRDAVVGIVSHGCPGYGQHHWVALRKCARRPTAAAYALLAIWRKRHKQRGVPVYLVRDTACMVLHSAGEYLVWGRVCDEGE